MPSHTEEERLRALLGDFTPLPAVDFRTAGRLPPVPRPPTFELPGGGPGKTSDLPGYIDPNFMFPQPIAGPIDDESVMVNQPFQRSFPGVIPGSKEDYAERARAALPGPATMRESQGRGDGSFAFLDDLFGGGGNIGNLFSGGNIGGLAGGAGAALLGANPLVGFLMSLLMRRLFEGQNGGKDAQGDDGAPQIALMTNEEIEKRMREQVVAAVAAGEAEGELEPAADPAGAIAARARDGQITGTAIDPSGPSAASIRAGQTQAALDRLGLATPAEAVGPSKALVPGEGLPDTGAATMQYLLSQLVGPGGQVRGAQGDIGSGNLGVSIDPAGALPRKIAPVPRPRPTRSTLPDATGFTQPTSTALDRLGLAAPAGAPTAAPDISPDLAADIGALMQSFIDPAVVASTGAGIRAASAGQVGTPSSNLGQLAAQVGQIGSPVSRAGVGQADASAGQSVTSAPLPFMTSAPAAAPDPAAAAAWRIQAALAANAAAKTRGIYPPTQNLPTSARGVTPSVSIPSFGHGGRSGPLSRSSR